MTDQIDSRDWATTASVCEFLAVSLAYPDDAVVQAIQSGEWSAAVCEIAGVLGVELDAEVETWADSEEAKHALRREATRLFLGPHEPPVSIYEGIWSAHDRGVAPLLFVSQAAMDVERFCAACGLGRPAGTNESLDHCSTELEVLQYLASVEAGIVVPCEGAPTAEKLPGGSAAEAYGEFFNDHIITWMPRFADALERETRLGFYKVAAQILRAFVDSRCHC